MNDLINFFSEEIEFTLKNKRKTREWIKQVIEKEDYICGSVNIIFCSDKFLLKLNKKYLNRNTLTDVITFPMAEDETVVSGDIFISKERVFENAKSLLVKPSLEMLRVVIHGILHLLGYCDSSDEEKKVMRRKEDFYLKEIIN
ncbi:MAG: rRNA maturation RNase YbeY [Bacteroidales bacterium]|nr:rRNA maturation RNase YbeY [Bacteroidales bacterium]MDD4602411.1 rRNA maturation RNase YbeY [Bacteroidales bacterium]